MSGDPPAAAQEEAAAPPMCSICAEDAGGADATTLECGHAFHVACALQWFRYENTTCPNCRSEDSRQVWSRLDASARLAAMRRRRARLPRAVARPLAQLDACTARAAQLRRERRALRRTHREVFASDGRLRGRIGAMDRRARSLRRTLGGATVAGVPHLRYHGDLGDDVEEEEGDPGWSSSGDEGVGALGV